MRMRTWVVAPALLVALAFVASAADAEKTVKDELEKNKAGGAARVQRVQDDVVRQAFPDLEFFSVVFPQFPVARLAPEPYKSSNLYAATKDGKLTLVTEFKGLQKLMGANKYTTDKEIVAAAQAWAILSANLHQDGFYKFALAEKDDIKVVADGDTKTVKASVVVKDGGTGQLNVKLSFQDGKLTGIGEDVKIEAGPRPRIAD